MKKGCVLLVIITLFVSTICNAENDGHMDIFKKTNENPAVVVTAIPIKTQEISKFLFNTNIISKGLIGIMLTLENKTSETYFIDNEFIYTNRFNEKRISLTKTQFANTINAEKEEMLIMSALLFGLTGMMVALISQNNTIVELNALDYLSYYTVPPLSTISGLIIFDYTDYIIYDKVNDISDAGGQQEIDIKGPTEAWPILGTSLSMTITDSSGKKAIIEMTFNKPDVSISLKEIEEKLKIPAEQKRIFVGDLPKDE